MSLLLKYISMRPRRASKIRGLPQERPRGLLAERRYDRVGPSLGFRDVTSRVEHQVFIHRWPPAVSTGLVRTTSHSGRAAAGSGVGGKGEEEFKGRPSGYPYSNV